MKLDRNMLFDILTDIFSEHGHLKSESDTLEEWSIEFGCCTREGIHLELRNVRYLRFANGAVIIAGTVNDVEYLERY